MDQQQPRTPADALVEFLNSLLAARESRSMEELRESVQAMGMDPEHLLARAREQVARAREQARLGWVTRAQALLPQIRAGLQKTPIARRLSRGEQIKRIREAAEGVLGERAGKFVAAFHKFENLPDEDLASLVEDIEVLRLLEQEPDDEQS